MEHPFVLGTAGHIDHGKTKLVSVLTGVDCDRLNEEKRRGITIELGFAPLALPSGRTVSVVDVPGHERFIRQMVAGSAGIDAAMLLIAADEGIMPQTREHLSILDLLGIARGVVVISKTDLVDEETLSIAMDEARTLVAGTFLQDAPILRVSAQEGEGIEDLLCALDALVDATPTRPSEGSAFMPIDRTFTMRGFGSVVTGTINSGTLREGDEVDVLPSALHTKIRSIQIHGAQEKCARAGQRTAMNLASVSVEQLRRGDVVCEKGRFQPTECVDAWLDVLPAAREPISHWQRVRLHIGTIDVTARVSCLGKQGKGGDIPPGSGGIVQLFPETPIVAAYGQRFVVRFYSPLETIAGGRVLFPYAHRPHDRNERELRENILFDLAGNDSPENVLACIIRSHGPVGTAKLQELSQMRDDTFADAIATLRAGEGREDYLSFGATENIFIESQRLHDLLTTIRDELDAFHREHPELFGMSQEELCSALGGDATFGLRDPRDCRDFLLTLSAKGELRHLLVEGEAKFSLPYFKPRVDGDLQKLVGRIRDICAASRYELPEMSRLPEQTGAKPAEITRAIGFLREHEGLKIVGEGMLLSGDVFRQLQGIVSSLGGDITIASLRDTLGTSRKYALAVLEFFDSAGITRRVGDKRVLLRKER